MLSTSAVVSSAMTKRNGKKAKTHIDELATSTVSQFADLVSWDMLAEKRVDDVRAIIDRGEVERR